MTSFHQSENIIVF